MNSKLKLNGSFLHTDERDVLLGDGTVVGKAVIDRESTATCLRKNGPLFTVRTGYIFKPNRRGRDLGLRFGMANDLAHFRPYRVTQYKW